MPSSNLINGIFAQTLIRAFLVGIVNTAYAHMTVRIITSRAFITVKPIKHADWFNSKLKVVNQTPFCVNLKYL